MPLGVDLHTLDKKQHRMSACVQQREFWDLASTLPPWQARTAQRVLAPFGGTTPERRRAWKALAEQDVGERWAGSRQALWLEVGQYAFVACPFGHGVDTHRLWEVLALGSVPVVRTSSLDVLYAEFPVVVVQSWDHVNSSALQLWRQLLQQRWGEEVVSPAVQHRLTIDYWVGRIQAITHRLTQEDR
jgi:hypothetical protein